MIDIIKIGLGIALGTLLSLAIYFLFTQAEFWWRSRR